MSIPKLLRKRAFLERGIFWWLLAGSIGAGLLWDRHGPDATFLAGAGVAAVAMAMLSLLPDERAATSA